MEQVTENTENGVIENMTTDTTEKGLETLIVEAMTGKKADSEQIDMGKEATALYGGTGWILGRWQDYDREYAVDLVQLTAFLKSTQPEVAESLDLDNSIIPAPRGRSSLPACREKLPGAG
jgi:hypothetical protein